MGVGTTEEVPAQPQKTQKLSVKHAKETLPQSLTAQNFHLVFYSSDLLRLREVARELQVQSEN